MKKTLLVLLTSIFLVLAGCGGAGDNTQEEGFNFIFKYGVTGANVLDTFQGKFTKDMISEAPITIEFNLTSEEMDSIYQKMLEIDFFSYPDEFEVTVPEGELARMVLPYSSYYFKVEHAGGIKELTWEDKITNTDAQADKLKELIHLIRDIIELKPEYLVLPEPSGGYL
jgi:protein involved in sex pheromone biosynthesis